MNKDIRRVVRQPRRIYTGYLAEAYDGIGQYVKVSLARSSTSVAMKARIASGDFGGSRRFPAGTRVPVVSIRGQLEVLLGNIPSGCLEHFNRTVTNGWGNSEFPSLDGWRYSNGEPGDDWYRAGNPEYFSVQNSIARIDTNVFGASFEVSDPWIWFFPKGDPASYVLDTEYEIRFRVLDFDPVVIAGRTGVQLDFYIGDSEQVGTIGSIGDVFYVTMDWTGTSGNRVPRLRTYYFGDLGNGSYFESGPLDINLWDGSWLILKWKLKAPGDIRAKLWREQDPEPDWQAGWTSSHINGWNGLRIFTVGAYRTFTFSPTTSHPTIFEIDYIRDKNKRICKMNGTDFIPSFNV